MNNAYFLQKSKQLCFLFPWDASAPVPWPPGYARVLVPLPRGRTNRDGSVANVQVVNAKSLYKRIDNRIIPDGQWIQLT